MKNVFVGMVVIAASILLAAPATASTVAIGSENPEAVQMKGVEPPVPDYTFSPALRAGGPDLLQMDLSDQKEDSLYEVLGKVFWMQSPLSISMFDVKFQCATEDAYTDWIKPAPAAPVFADKDLVVDHRSEPASFSSLDQARLEAASRLSQNSRHESGFLLYERDDGSIGISEKISGNTRSLHSIRLASLAGRTVTMKGTHGIDGNYPVLEIVHTHPPHSTHLHSGGQGEGDVYVAESLGINVSVVHGNGVHLYQPEGKNIAHRLPQVRGELVAMLNNP